MNVREALRVRGLLPLAIEIASRRHVATDDLLGSARTKSVAAARRELYAALRAKGLSYPEIGALLGRDHTSVMLGVRKCGPLPEWLCAELAS